MKIILSLAVITALVASEHGTSCRAAEEDGVALAIIYDTSGSMHDSVRDTTGRLSPKYTIANRALKNAVTWDLDRAREEWGPGRTQSAPRTPPFG